MALNYFDKDRLSTVLLLLPAIFLVGYFVYVGILWNIIVSLSDWKGLIASYNIKGFDEYLKLFNDSVFITSLQNNVFIIIFFVPLTLLVGLFLDRKKSVMKVFLELFSYYLLPYHLLSLESSGAGCIIIMKVLLIFF